MRINRRIGAGLAALGALVWLAACATPDSTPIVQTIEVTREVTRAVEVTRIVEVTPEGGVPFEALWAASPHADASAEAFAHWNQDDPAQVPEACARCHSTPGYLDYVGADGSAAGKVDAPAPVGTVVECRACHNDVSRTLTTVAFPSGAEVSALGPEARCLLCHQGRASMAQVDAAIRQAGLTDDDTVAAELGFINIHYYAAAVSRYGAQVRGGYEYPGRAYDVLFDHVEGVVTCVDCHDPHSLQVKVDQCQGCHGRVSIVEDLRDIRMASSLADYDGDGDTDEGVYYEIAGLREALYAAMQAYAVEVSQAPIVYEPSTYPYFFIDTDADGAADPEEVVFDNRYNAWTGRLEKAAYNYQTSLKDPGAYAHGGKYILQLLYDSLADLNTRLSVPVDMTAMRRTDAGHFAGSEEAFRHWDEDGQIPGACAKCHSPAGLPTFVANGTNIAAQPGNGFLCSTCHKSLADFSLYSTDSVRFPSGAALTFGEGEPANLCLNCHQGRESTQSVNGTLSALGLGEDESSERIRFRNIHYFAAGSTLFGTEAKGAYEYAGQAYRSRFLHGDLGPTQCLECHSTHGLGVMAVDACQQCHRSVRTAADLAGIRLTEGDFDGDGDEAEGLAAEVAGVHEKLYAAIQAYARDRVGQGIVYDAHAYPYWFLDANGDGLPDLNDGGAPIGYNAWTPRLLKAGYNYQYGAKDPGAYAHNGLYVLQILYDSLRDVGGDVRGMQRP